MLRRCLPLLIVALAACSSGRRTDARSAQGGGAAPSPAARPWVYPPSWMPVPMSFNSATPDRWFVQTSGGRMLCETPCSTWVPPDTGLELQHAEDTKTVLRISKNRLASFEGRPAALVVKRDKSYATMLSLVAAGAATAGLGAVFIGFGAAADCESGAEVLCGTGGAFIGTGLVLGLIGVAIGGRMKSTYELEEVPPWYMGRPGVPPPGYVPPAELLPAPRRDAPQQREAPPPDGYLPPKPGEPKPPEVP